MSKIALRGKNCDMSTPPVTDPTLNAGEAGKRGVTIRHCLLDYASLEFRLQAPPRKALHLELCDPSTVLLHTEGAP